ncbi:hypothetical protein PsYK624_070570 [Phanerochaete sordida]|uniref:Uncharacterized protein n=1 Tax=Phanerochaete sordida TaxID=48140 RepID=A0A9P3LCW3_9APHY|nr:hypothetical protein PsYK624_070570 [Phanerochaete sordida]
MLLAACPSSRFRAANAIIVCDFTPVASLYADTFLVIVAARVPTILSDALVLAVTLRRTWRVYSNARRARLRAPFAEILIRDGTVYFLASLIMNVAEVLVCNVLGQVYLLPFICSVTGILFTRLFFDLRALADAERACPRGLSELETPEFRMATTCHADTSWVLASSAGDYETEPRVDLV